MIWKKGSQDGFDIVHVNPVTAEEEPGRGDEWGVQGSRQGPHSRMR